MAKKAKDSYKGATFRGHQTDTGDGRHYAKHHKENSYIEAIDRKRNYDLLLESQKKLQGLLKKLTSGKIDIQGLFHGVSPEAAMQLIHIALDGENEKNKLDATKHLLALAGHAPTTKHEFHRIDPETPKAALISIIAGGANDLKEAEIEVVDDREEGQRAKDVSEETP